jgi:beta-glucosidase/6-phospho-beta-glucosidase/beta-galactosidase
MQPDTTAKDDAVRHIMLATGIECSYPTVQGGKRRDQLDETGHYDHWHEDLELCREVGARFVRYGPPYYKMHTGPHKYDWSWTDEVLPVMLDIGLTPIVDLCHFGLPDWAGDFQNNDWSFLFADYAEAFARRYPWIKYYTPVNEILVCARFSAKEGIWNEQLKSDKAMVTAHGNMCSATLNGIKQILEVRPDAVFIQSETAEAFFASCPEASRDTEFRNELRFITFDFLYGNEVEGEVLKFLMDNGVSWEDYKSTLEYGRRYGPHCIMGMDYYAANERLVVEDGSEKEIGPVLGWHSIALQYYERYRKPMMLTETNTLDAETAPDWLWKTWYNIACLRAEGIPVIGFTWYSLQDQVDWDIQLREIRGKVNGNGLYGLDRKAKPVADAFKELCRRYGNEPLLQSFPTVSLTGTSLLKSHASHDA